MSKPGRNDPCYCGSGKKYKQCHLREDQAAERAARARADAARFLRLELPSFAREERFESDFDAALPIYWNDYYDAENAEEMSEFEALRFLDWFVFDHVLGSGSRVIDIYHEEFGQKLNPLQTELLASWLDAPPASAYKLTGYDGQLLHLQDVFSEENFDLFEAGGRGNVQVGEVILARRVPVFDKMEFSTVAAYLPKDEVAGLVEKMEAAKEADAAEHPQATHEEFMRRNNHLIIHHALAKAEEADRPPVARLDPHRVDPPIKHRASHEKERVIRQRSYGRTQNQPTSTRRKAI